MKIKTKYINIILLIILILICIILLYTLFSNKHNEIYNEINKIILKEKFNTGDKDCMNAEKQIICPGVPLKCKASNEEEKCENTRKYDEYCSYLSGIGDVLKSSCFSCDEKNNIVSTARRAKCLSLTDAIDETTYKK